MAVYPGDKNHLPYDVIVQTMRTNEPEPPALPPSRTKIRMKCWTNTPFLSKLMVSGRPSPMPGCEEAAYGEYKENLRRTAENFHIIDDQSGRRRPKAKFQANIEGNQVLK